MTRRAVTRFLAVSAVFICLACAGTPAAHRTLTPAAGPAGLVSDSALLDDVELRGFHYFWDLADPHTMLVPDRAPTPSFSSIAAVGFGLTAYGIGAERGYVTRAEAAGRTLATLRSLLAMRQGPEPRGVSGYKGFFYHFLDMRTAERFQTVELSTIDTSLLMAGVLFSQSYFDRGDATETAIRAAAEELYERVDWPCRAGAAAGDQHGLDPRGGAPYLRLARLQRGDDRPHPRPRLADASGRRRAPGASTRRPTAGALSTARITSCSRPSSATSTRTSGSIFVASATR